jgi:hypothetical protein
VTAYLESDSNRNINGPAGTDGGTSWNVYEAGTDKKLTPLVVEDGGGRDKSLVGYWTFDEGSGTIAKDYSGNGNNGTLINGPTWTTGKVGYALSFDGVDDYVQVNDSPSLKPKYITLIAWVGPRPNTNNGQIISKTETGNYSLGYEGGSARGGFFVGGSYLNVTTPIPSITEWHFIAASYDGLVANIYIDGIKKRLLFQRRDNKNKFRVSFNRS